MTYDVTIRAADGTTLDNLGEVKDFVTFVKLNNKIVEDSISQMEDKFITIDVYPDHIRYRYRGFDGKDRKTNVTYTKDIIGFDVIFD